MSKKIIVGGLMTIYVQFKLLLVLNLVVTKYRSKRERERERERENKTSKAQKRYIKQQTEQSKHQRISLCHPFAAE